MKKNYTLEEVRDALASNPLIGFKEVPVNEVRLGSKLHCDSGLTEFHVWPKKPSKNINYLNNIFSNLLPEVEIISDGIYDHFRFDKESIVLYYPLFSHISEVVGKRYEAVEVVFSKLSLREKFNNSKKEHWEETNVTYGVRIYLYPSEKLSTEREDWNGRGGVSGEALDELPDYKG